MYCFIRFNLRKQAIARMWKLSPWLIFSSIQETGNAANMTEKVFQNILSLDKQNFRALSYKKRMKWKAGLNGGIRRNSLEHKTFTSSLISYLNKTMVSQSQTAALKQTQHNSWEQAEPLLVHTHSRSTHPVQNCHRKSFYIPLNIWLTSLSDTQKRMSSCIICRIYMHSLLTL